MPDVAAVRAAIVANVSAVPDLGQMHDYERYEKNYTAMRAFYEFNSQIRGWHLTMRSLATRNIAIGRDVVTTVWQLRGFMSLSDAAVTEKTFADLVNTIRNAMRADESLGGTADTITAGGTAGWQLLSASPVMFAGVLCHSATLELTTVHYE